jgi:hypothetical protein
MEKMGNPKNVVANKKLSFKISAPNRVRSCGLWDRTH